MTCRTTTIFQQLQNITKIYSDCLSYADALKAAIQRTGDFSIDGFVFKRRTDISIPTDYVSIGRHTMIYTLEGTGKQYKIMIEPVQETHGRTKP